MSLAGWALLVSCVSLVGIAVNVTLLACQTRYMRRADERAERQHT